VFLLRFLRARKFDYDRAYNLLINYYTIRANNADIIGHMTPSSVEHTYDSGAVTLLPHRDKEGRRIMYFNAGVLQRHIYKSLFSLYVTAMPDRIHNTEKKKRN